MTRALLPGARAAIVGAGGLAERSFYSWMQAINRAVNDGGDVDQATKEAIAGIAKALGSPDGSVDKIPKQGLDGVINGNGSILVDGTLESGAVNLSLAYDTLTPGATAYYGSGSSGDRGWFPVASALSDSTAISPVADPATGVVAFNLKPTGVVAGTFGAGVKLLLASVGEDGRLSGLSEYPLLAGNGISFDTNPDTGAVTISVNGFANNFRVTRTGDQRVTRNGDIRITR